MLSFLEFFSIPVHSSLLRSEFSKNVVKQCPGSNQGGTADDVTDSFKIVVSVVVFFFAQLANGLVVLDVVFIVILGLFWGSFEARFVRIGILTDELTEKSQDFFICGGIVRKLGLIGRFGIVFLFLS